MQLNRRGLVVTTGAMLLNAAPGAAAQTSAVAPTAPDRSRELHGLLLEADRLGLGGPRSAGPLDPLDLAELIEEAMAKPAADQEAATLAERAGLILAELTRDERDGRATEEPAPAARQDLTPAMEREYRSLFASAQIRPTATPELSRVARFVMSARVKERYKELEADTGVPWFVVGAIHYREANLNFMGHLHNGDPLLLRTVHVPERRPPAPWPLAGLSPAELWRRSARDALRGFASSGGWTLPKIAFLLEAYNGFGCRNNGIHSPYLWNYTQHYTRGGFPSDHVFSPNYVSKQAGLMAVLVAIKQIDPEVVFPA